MQEYGKYLAIRKLYAVHAKDGEPTEEYFKWARKGWEDSYAHRYPMGKGAKPLYSLWDGKKLDYIAARKIIYGPFYISCVINTISYRELKKLCEATEKTVILRDFDGYHDDGLTLTEILNNPKKKCGHAFFLKAMLTNDPMLKELATHES